MKPDFDEWMSGRYWLGDKAPKEGFYERYSSFQIFMMRGAFEFGVEGLYLGLTRIADEDVRYLMKWSREVGELMTNKEEK